MSIRSQYVCLKPLLKIPRLTLLPHHKVKYVPEWFPGAGFKTFAREGRDQFNLAVNGPLAYVRRSLEVSRY